MPVLQRTRRAQPVTIHTSVTTTDRRGNKTIRPLGDPISVKAWIVPERSSRAEVTGQQQINVVRMGTRSDLTGVDMRGLAFWNGSWWDIVSPPEHHIGDRHTRHWTFLLRERPDDGGLADG